MTVDSGAASLLKNAVEDWGRRVLDQAAETMPDQMRGYAPIRTGELRSAIQADPGSAVPGVVMTRRIIVPVIQARTTDQGAPAHIIRATRVHGLLVFEVGGQTVFTRKPVHHPGNDPRPWFERALEATWGPNLRYAALHTSFG